MAHLVTQRATFLGHELLRSKFYGKLNMAAGNYDIIVDQGSDYTLSVTVKDDSTTVSDLTGYSARAHIRPAKASDTLTASFTCTVDTSSPATGIVEMTLPNSVSKNIAAGSYFYDLEIFTASDAIVKRIIQGKVKVTQEVTR